MKAFLSSWWKQCRAHPVLSFVVVAAVIIVVWIIFAGGLNGSGFTGGYQITTSRIVSGPSAGTVTQTGVYQSGKTLWDWLQLLIVPVVLAVGGSLISVRISQVEQEAAKQHDKTEREIAEDNQREASLQDYIDKMSHLLLEKDLRNSKLDDERQKMARVRTLTILSRLDPERKKSLLQFLYEAELINKTNSIIVLKGANLSKAKLSGVHLVGANLVGVNLTEADLSGANLGDAELAVAELSGACLIGTGLMHAVLIGVNLSHACLIKADMSRVCLIEANLFSANLSGAYLDRANLSGADLNGANLSGADLSGADLSGAYLGGTDLNGANLSGADLSGADLRTAIFEKTQLDKAKTLTDAKLPANFPASS